MVSVQEGGEGRGWGMGGRQREEREGMKERGEHESQRTGEVGAVVGMAGYISRGGCRHSAVSAQEEGMGMGGRQREGRKEGRRRLNPQNLSVAPGQRGFRLHTRGMPAPARAFLPRTRNHTRTRIVIRPRRPGGGAGAGTGGRWEGKGGSHCDIHDPAIGILNKRNVGKEIEND